MGTGREVTDMARDYEVPVQIRVTTYEIGNFIGKAGLCQITVNKKEVRSHTSVCSTSSVSISTIGNLYSRIPEFPFLTTDVMSNEYALVSAQVAQ